MLNHCITRRKLVSNPSLKVYATVAAAAAVAN